MIVQERMRKLDLLSFQEKSLRFDANVVPNYIVKGFR